MSSVAFASLYRLMAQVKLATVLPEDVHEMLVNFITFEVARMKLAEVSK